MRIVFMGTPAFAVPILRALIENYDVVGVFTQPDKAKGRHMTLTPSEVKVCATEHNIPVFQPETLKHGEAMPILEELKPDVIVVAAYGQILRNDVLEFAKYGCINAHGSLLPKYRGAAPIQWAVLDGEEYAGTTIMTVKFEVDSGDILLQKQVKIGENETAGELFNRISELSAVAMIEAIDDIENLIANRKEQGEPTTDYARMLTKEDSPIDWTKPAQYIHNHIRGLNPWPSATATLNGETFKVHISHMTNNVSDKKPGTIAIKDKRVFVTCGDKKEIELVEIQPQNGKRMPVGAYLLGHTLEGVLE